MSDLVADMLDEVKTQSPPAQQISPERAVQPASGDLVDQMLSEVEATPSKVSGAGTPESPYQAIIQFSQKIQEARQVGQLGFREAALGHAVAAGNMTLEEAESQIEADDQMAQMSGDLEAYEKAAWEPWITGVPGFVTGVPTSIAMATARQLPMLEESLKVAAPLGIGVGGLTAATGVGASVAVPAGAMAGTVGAAGWAADFITGHEYLERRRKGMGHVEALAASSVSGIVQGSLQGLQFGQMAKVPISAAGNILKAHAASMVNFLSEGVQFGAIQIGLSEAQTAMSLITDAVAGTVSKTPGVVPTLEQAVKEFGATFQETLKGSSGLFLGGKGAGTAAGLSGKTFLKGLQKAHDKHMENQSAKLEKIEQRLAEPPENEQTPSASTEEKAPSKTAQEKKKRAAERLKKREAAEREVNRIFDAANSLFTIEIRESKLQEASRVQRLLKRMITNSDKLDDGMKAKLLARVVEIDSVKDLLKEGQRFIEEQRGREYANDLAAAEKRLNNAISSGRQKGKKAALPPAVQATLKWYQEFFTPPKVEKVPGAPKREAGELQAQVKEAAFERAMAFVEKGIQEETKKLQEQVDLLQQDKLAEIYNQAAELTEKRRVALEAARFWSDSLTPESINALAERIEKTVEGGKSEFLERKQAESERLLKNREKLFNAIQGKKPVTPSLSTTPPKKITPIGQVLNSLRRSSTSLWDKLLQDTPFDERQKVVNDILDLTAVENKESTLNIQAVEKIEKLYSEAVGSMRESTRLIKNGLKSELFEQQYTDVDGASQTLGRHTLNELVYLHMAFEDRGAQAGLVFGNKFTLDGMVEVGGTSTQELVRQILSEREGGKYLKLAESVKEFYQWFGPLVGNHYLKEYGVELPMSVDYSGRIYHRGVEKLQSAVDILESAHSYVRQSLNPSSTKLRSDSKLPVKAVDPFVEIQRHRSQMSFWIANSEKARELSFVFSDSSKDGLRDVIAHKLGDDFKSLIDARLAWQFHLKPGVLDGMERSAQALKNQMATGLLGGRLDQAPKQWTTILAAFSTNTFPEFIDGLRGASSKERIAEYTSRSELFASRQHDLLPQILEATNERSYLDSVTGDRLFKLKEVALIPMTKWGDGVASAVTGFIEFNRVLKASGSVEEAVLAGDRLVDRIASSSRASQKVPAEFKGGLSGLSLTFAKQNIQYLNEESGAIRDAFIHKDAKHAGRAFRTIAAIHAAQALFQAINNIPGFLVGDDEEQQQAVLRVTSAAITGAYSSLPLVTFDVGMAALSTATGGHVSEPRTILGGLASDSFKLVTRWAKIAGAASEGEDIEGEQWTRAFQSLASVSSIATGLPFWGLFKSATFGSKVVEKAEGEE